MNVDQRQRAIQAVARQHLARASEGKNIQIRNRAVLLLASRKARNLLEPKRFQRVRHAAEWMLEKALKGVALALGFTVSLGVLLAIIIPALRLAWRLFLFDLSRGWLAFLIRHVPALVIFFVGFLLLPYLLISLPTALSVKSCAAIELNFAKRRFLRQLVDSDDDPAFAAKAYRYAFRAGPVWRGLEDILARLSFVLGTLSSVVATFPSLWIGALTIQVVSELLNRQNREPALGWLVFALCVPVALGMIVLLQRLRRRHSGQIAMQFIHDLFRR
jgi:hypothetical protein